MKIFDNKKHKFYTANHASYSKDNIKIGCYTYGMPKVFCWNQTNQLIIGRYCSFAENVTIFLDGEHRTDWVSTYPFNFLSKEHLSITGHPKTKGDVIIGNDVWVGYGVTILRGVHIGDGAVIGAGSIVTKDVAAYEIVAGNPAKHIRYRFGDEERKKLQLSKWWMLPRSQIKTLIPYLLSSNVDAFISAVKNLKENNARRKKIKNK